MHCKSHDDNIMKICEILGVTSDLEKMLIISFKYLRRYLNFQMKNDHLSIKISLTFPFILFQLHFFTSMCICYKKCPNVMKQESESNWKHALKNECVRYDICHLVNKYFIWILKFAIVSQYLLLIYTKVFHTHRRFGCEILDQSMV